MSELKAFDITVAEEGYCEGIVKYRRHVYDKSDADKVIAELKDKCQMHDFFWEGCGFSKRGFKNTIAVSEAFDELEIDNAKLKRKIEFLKVTHGSCGDCNKCADGMGKVFDENLNELKVQKAQAEDDVAFWKAKAKGEM
jgi:hypothetical protein